MFPHSMALRPQFHCKLIAGCLCCLLGLHGLTANAQVTATWDENEIGEWTDEGKWNTPDYPDNGNGGNDYNAVIGSGTVTVNQDITIEDLTFTGGTITGANSLTSQKVFSWTGGTFAGSGTTSINNGTITGSSSTKLNSRTLEIFGEVNLLEGPINSTTLGTIAILNGASFDMAGSHTGSREVQANFLVDDGGVLSNSGFQFTSIKGNVINNGTIEVGEDGFVTIAAGSGDGDMIVRNNAGLVFELQNANDYQFTGRIILDGGLFDLLLFNGSGVTFLIPDLLSGNGTYNGYGGTLVNSTEISPGFSIGSITIDANYEQTSEGKLTIEVDDNTTSDTVDITGDAMLGGTVEIIVTDESQLTLGTMIEVLTADSLMGTQFDDVTTTSASGIVMAPVYSGTSFFAVPVEPGDMNHDGVITSDDIDEFALALTDPNRYRRGPAPGKPNGWGMSPTSLGDLDHDTDFDVDDIGLFAAALNMSLAQLNEQILKYSTQVPEPATMWLAFSGTLLRMLRRNGS